MNFGLGFSGGGMDVLAALPTIDCSTNPNYPATNGIGYRVSVAGKIGGASGVSVYVNDILKPVATAVSGTHAAVGASWAILHNHQATLVVDYIDLSSATYAVPWGHSRVSTQQDIAESTTLVNATGLVQAGLIAGKSYSIEVELLVTSTANNGFKCAFATPDTLTATSFWATGKSFDNAGDKAAYTKVTTLTGEMCAATALIERVSIIGHIVVNAAGTLRLQVAPNASHADLLSILPGSKMIITQLQV